MKISSTLLTIFCILNISPIFGDECRPIRLDIGEKAPLKNLPIHDQMYGKKKDSQMCYAFASAQFVNSHLRNEAPNSNHITSPITTALQVKLKEVRADGSRINLSSNISRGAGFSGLGVGQVNDLLEELKNGYSCDENHLRSFGIKDPNDFWLPFRTYMYQADTPGVIKDLKSDLKAIGINDKFFTRFSDEDLLEVLKRQGFYLRQEMVFNKLCEDGKIELNLPELHYSDYMPTEVGYHETSEEMQTRYQVDKVNSYAISDISSGLTNGSNLPVITDICTEVLIDHKNSFKRSLPTFNASCSPHSVIIIGQRRNQETNACEYLVRNSMGDYRQYDKEWQLDEKGQIWVDAKTYSRSVLKVIYAK